MKKLDAALTYLSVECSNLLDLIIVLSTCDEAVTEVAQMKGALKVVINLQEQIVNECWDALEQLKEIQDDNTNHLNELIKAEEGGQ